jgi:hypothetical protein
MLLWLLDSILVSIGKGVSMASSCVCRTSQDENGFDRRLSSSQLLGGSLGGSRLRPGARRGSMIVPEHSLSRSPNMLQSHGGSVPLLKIVMQTPVQSPTCKMREHVGRMKMHTDVPLQTQARESGICRSAGHPPLSPATDGAEGWICSLTLSIMYVHCVIYML